MYQKWQFPQKKEKKAELFQLFSIDKNKKFPKSAYFNILMMLKM